MTDSERVKRMRENRRKAGFTETNVWIPESVRQVIDSKVVSGEFPTRRMAIITALEKVFVEGKTGT